MATYRLVSVYNQGDEDWKDFSSLEKAVEAMAIADQYISGHERKLGNRVYVGEVVDEDSGDYFLTWDMSDYNKELTSVEVWDKNTGWQAYDCPPSENGDTVESYANWCIGENSDYWATVNSREDKIRLNGWFVVDGKNHFPLKTVGQNLRDARAAFGMTQKELAQNLGTTQQQIAKYESGEQEMTVSRLREIEKQLQLDPGELLKNT
jgi:DNA-binding XRE family transcriptional regulator